MKIIANYNNNYQSQKQQTFGANIGDESLKVIANALAKNSEEKERILLDLKTPVVMDSIKGIETRGGDSTITATKHNVAPNCIVIQATRPDGWTWFDYLNNTKDCTIPDVISFIRHVCSALINV